MAKQIAVCAALAALGACAGESKRSEAQLADLIAMFPGSYSNAQQVQADNRTAGRAHAALEVNIARVYAPRISDFTFYVQESAADDPRRIFTQRLVAFKNDKGHIVESLWNFAEPVRWRDAHDNLDLFKAMTMQDLVPMTGCELTWIWKPGSLEASNDQANCRISSASAGGMVRLKLRAKLSVDELSLAEQSFDSTGRAVQQEDADPFYRYQRR